jgi:lipid-binding SYLF domain-containing protein
MQVRFRRLVVAIALLLIFPLAQAFAENPAKLSKKCDEAIGVFKAAGKSGEFFAKSHGYAVFPSVGKGAVVVGGAHGNGCVFEQGKRVGDAELSQVNIGFSFGGKSFSQIVFFEDKRAMDEFTSGSFEFGAEAAATMITADATAKTSTAGSTAGASGGKHDAATTGGWYKGMATFIVAKGGAMADASVGGQKFSYKPGA